MFSFYIRFGINKGKETIKDGPYTRKHLGRLTIAWGKLDFEDLLEDLMKKGDSNKQVEKELEDAKKKVKELTGANERFAKDIEAADDRITDLEDIEEERDELLKDVGRLEGSLERVSEHLDIALRYFGVR